MAWLEFADIALLSSRAVWSAPDTVRCKLLMDRLASWSCAAAHPACCPRPAVTTIRGLPWRPVSAWACVKAAGSSGPLGQLAAQSAGGHGQGEFLAAGLRW